MNRTASLFEPHEIGSRVGKAEFEAALPELRVRLLNAQFDLRVADFSVLLLLAGDDLQGVDELLDVLHEWMDARYMGTHVFQRPTERGLERPHLFRYWSALPPRGCIGIYVGGWAAEAVREAVEEREDGVDRRRLEHIRRFEQTLVADGTLLLKVWVHLPKAEQRKRLKKAKKDPDQARLPDGAWQLNDDYPLAIEASAELLSETDSADAPWMIVEGTDARHRNLSVARALAAALEARLAAPRGTPIPSPALPAPPDLLATVDLTAELAVDAYRKQRDELQGRLWRLWREARAANRSAVLVFEGWDAAGKGGCIRRITGPLEARDYRVVPIGAPSEEERAHHYLWRFWRQLPRAGHIVIFDRSWYGRVLVERVEGLAREDEWHRGYAEINEFEEQLDDHGIAIVKFWLHLDPDEQLRRFRAREKTPYKKYKITDEDYRNRDRWGDYVAAANEMLARTSVGHAPWHLVASTDKRWARVRVLEETCRALERIVKTS
jgi:polyphosphate:AMP phosphotransferase